MVDPERLHRLLRRVSDDLAVLQGYAGVDPEDLAADPVRLGHVKYLLVTLLEGVIDGAQHVCAAEGYGPPDTNASALLLLGRHGTVDGRIATSMAQAVRLRNVLVHRYADVDDRRVVRYLQELGDVEAYVAQLTLLL